MHAAVRATPDCCPPRGECSLAPGPQAGQLAAAAWCRFWMPLVTKSHPRCTACMGAGGPAHACDTRPHWQGPLTWTSSIAWPALAVWDRVEPGSQGWQTLGPDRSQVGCTHPRSTSQIHVPDPAWEDEQVAGARLISLGMAGGRPGPCGWRSGAPGSATRPPWPAPPARPACMWACALMAASGPLGGGPLPGPPLFASCPPSQVPLPDVPSCLCPQQELAEVWLEGTLWR